MRNKIYAGISAPLMFGLMAAALAGCPTGTAFQEDPNPPNVVAIYMVDDHPELLRTAPDFFFPMAQNLIYHKDDTRVSTKAPASYNSIWIEFDKPLDGASLGDIATRTGTDHLGVGSFSFCKQSPAIKVKDVTNNRDLVVSTCFDASSSIGSNPHLILHLSSDSLAAAPNPFTCQSFDLGAPFGNSLLANNKYSITLDAAQLKGSNGKAIVLPTGGNGGAWSSGTFSFTTGGMDPVAVYYIDPGTGYNVYHSKPQKGYMKDKDAESAFEMINTVDSVNFLYNLPVNFDGNGDPADVSSNPVTITVKRSDGTTFPGTPLIFNLDAVGRQIELTPTLNFATGQCGYIFGFGCTGQWEPGVEYTVTIPGTLAGYDFTNTTYAMGTDQVVKFKVADTNSLGATGSEPPDAQTAVSFRFPSFSPSGGAQLAVEVAYPVPIDAATVTATSAVLKEKVSGTVVDSTVSVLTSRNEQIVRIAPKANLKPGTSYSVSMTGLKTKGGLVSHAAAAVPDFSSSFTTTNFALGTLRDRGAVFGGTLRTRNLDRVATATPFLLLNGQLGQTFADVPGTNASGTFSTTIPAGGLKLLEVKADGSTTNLGISIAGTGTERVLTVTDAGYPLKFNTKYLVQGNNTITNPNGVALQQEGCVAATSTNNCLDQRSFTTGPFAARLNIQNAATGQLRVRFGHTDVTRSPDRIKSFVYEFAATSLQKATGADLSQVVKLYKQDASGNLTQVGSTCAEPTADATSFTCDATAALDPNSNYVWTVVFTSDKPAIVATQVTDTTVTPNVKRPADQTTGRFFGARQLAFTTPCP